MIRMLNNITAGNPRVLAKPVFYTTLAYLGAIAPLALTMVALQLIFVPFVRTDAVWQVSSLWWICGGMAAALVLQYVLEWPAFRAQFYSAYSAAADGRARLAEHLRRLPLGYLQRRDPADLASMMMGDFTLVEHGISHLVPQMFGAALMPLITLSGLAFLDWRMALALLAALPLSVLLMVVTSRIQLQLGQRHVQAKIEATNRLQEYLNGIRVIKAYNLTGDRFVRLKQSFAQLMKRSIRIEGVMGPIVLSAIALLRSGLSLMIVCGVYWLLDGTLDVIVFASFLIIGTRIYEPLASSLVHYAEFRYFEKAGERIIQLLQESPMPGDKEPPAANDITFKKVSFGYNNTKVLDTVNLSIPVNSFTALVGPSGSGKSTLLRLIARFYDPDSGTVEMGGEPLSAMDPEALLRRISMVFQDVYLFQDTIANNIRFGRSDASQAEIEAVAREACCHEFIMKLPNGYETNVGEGGSTLSGGEKQRISIARAMLKNAPVILLDEATASLDPGNEVLIQQAINRLIAGRTVIVVAHRLKTIKDADQIIVLNKGKIVQQGQHEGLLKEGGLYARLWNLQQDSAGWKISS